MSQTAVQKKYDRLSPVYDAFFSSILESGRQDVIHKINMLAPSSVLELGIGTGLSLAHYRPDHHVTGIDISARMIEKAKRRKIQYGLTNVRLMHMDAEQLSFPDNSFDVVVALYVFSTTSSPHALITQAGRVCRSGGRVFILNHFSRQSSGMTLVEKGLLPLTQRIGWKSYFAIDQIHSPALRLIDSKKSNMFGYWQALEYERI